MKQLPQDQVALKPQSQNANPCPSARQQTAEPYLIEHTAVPHHAALGMNVLAAALPLHLDDALHFWGNSQLPTQLSGKILGPGQESQHL